MKKKNMIITIALICGLSLNLLACSNQQTKGEKAKAEVNANDSSTNQTVPELNATRVYDFDFSEKAIKAFEADIERTQESIYDALGAECSFYCGCNMGEQKASSTLKQQGKQDYKASNIHDLDFSTTWIEGAEGYGIGEWVEYTLPAYNPRITELLIANGYVRTKKLWEENSRVKVLEDSVKFRR